jgi:signal transduction histidine kinase
MGSLQYQHRLMAEVSHQINSPLAAIRNALFLAATHTNDPQIKEYLEIADEEVSSIASRIRDLRAALECAIDFEAASPAPDKVHSMGRAA